MPWWRGLCTYVGMYIEVPSPPATKTGAFGREIESSQGGSLKSLKKQKIYHLECIISKILILCLMAVGSNLAWPLGT
jgi:hypothetical protein